MIVLWLSSVSKHNMWSYYDWVVVVFRQLRRDLNKLNELLDKKKKLKNINNETSKGHTEITKLKHIPWLWLWCLTPLSFNNISVILWRSVLLVQETGVPGEIRLPAASH